MNAEIIFLDIIGKLLLATPDIDLTMLSASEINHIFDHHLATKSVNLEDDTTTRPNIYLFRNKLIIKLVRNFGLLGSIKKAHELAINMNLVSNQEKVNANNIELANIVLTSIIDRLDSFYQIIVLEKISTLLILLEHTKAQHCNWLFQEGNILNFICARIDETNQINLEGTISPFYEIPHAEDEKYQRKVYNRKYSHKEKAYKTIIDYIPLDQLDSKINQLLEFLDSLYLEPSINSVDYSFFYCTAINIMATLNQDITKYQINRSRSNKADPNQLTLL